MGFRKRPGLDDQASAQASEIFRSRTIGVNIEDYEASPPTRFAFTKGNDTLEIYDMEEHPEKLVIRGVFQGKFDQEGNLISYGAGSEDQTYGLKDRLLPARRKKMAEEIEKIAKHLIEKAFRHLDENDL